MDENIDINNLTDEDMRLLNIIEWQGKVVKHFKGNFYLILDVHVQHTETNERMIYYKSLYGECKTYIRPAKMFIEKCTIEQYKQYEQQYRFELIELKQLWD